MKRRYPDYNRKSRQEHSKRTPPSNHYHELKKMQPKLSVELELQQKESLSVGDDEEESDETDRR